LLIPIAFNMLNIYSPYWRSVGRLPAPVNANVHYIEHTFILLYAYRVFPADRT
jgi:hypothetical protein